VKRPFASDYDFPRLFDEVLLRFRPDAIVCQCGADMLAFDPMGGFNLTLAGVERCVRKVLQASRPTLMLGGGGYVRPNAARLWTRLTALAVSMAEQALESEAVAFVLPEDIPDEDPFFTEYGPSFEFVTAPGQRKDMNNQEYVRNLLEAIKSM
jgi:histone deacetylase 8